MPVNIKNKVANCRLRFSKWKVAFFMKIQKIGIHIKAKIANYKLKFLTWRMASFIRIRKVGIHISFFGVTILGVLLAIILFSPFAQQAISQYKNVDTLFIAIGGMIGTMIALVFTLSIIPIQRAVETFSLSIAWMYRNDRVTQFIYIVLSLFCLLSFVLAIENIFQTKKSLLLPIGIFVVAVTFDMLRWHYRRISQMLTPRDAIERLTSKVYEYINNTQQRVSQFAQIQWKMLTEEQKGNQTKEQIETDLYRAFRNHYYPINNWTSELAEISYKAVGKNEIYSSELAIAALVRIACHYLDTRKGNMIVYPSSDALFLSSESDVNSVLSPIYEHLKNINRNAVTLKAETTCIHVVRAFGRIASHTASLKSPAFQEYTIPITGLPLGYLEECILSAQRNGLDDVVLQGSREVLNVTKSAPNNVQITDVYSPAIEAWNSMILTILVTGKGVFANEITKDLMVLLFNLLKQKHYQFNHTLGDVLRKIEALIPYAIAHEKMFGSPFVGLPLSVPYDLSNSLSIPYLVAQGKVLIKEEKDKEWINPYHDFIKINETIYRHLRNLAEKVDFGTSFLLWHIIQTIKHISRVYLSILQKSEPDNYGHVQELVGQILWYEAFFWVVFSRATYINKHHAEDACDVLAWIVMSFYDAGYLDVDAEFAKASTGNITSIMDSYIKICKNPNPYDVADFLISLWLIRLFAEGKKNITLIKIIDEKMAKPKMFSDAKWQEVLEALEVRKGQLNERLTKSDRYYSEEDATSLLQNILCKCATENV